MERYLRVVLVGVQAVRPAAGGEISPLPFVAIGLIATLIGAVLLFDVGGAATSLKDSTPVTMRGRTPAFDRFLSGIVKVLGGVAMGCGIISLAAGIAILIRRG